MKIFVWLVSALAVIVLFTLVFQDDKLAIEGNQIGKREFFAFASLVVSFAAVVSLAGACKVKLTGIDVLMALFGGYVVVNFFVNDSPAVSRIVLFSLLIALYYNLRLILSYDRRMVYVVIGVMLALGAAEAVVGLNQLLFKGYSNHGMHKITGSFFNPGPFGGYMAIVGVIAFSYLVYGYKRENSRVNAMRRYSQKQMSGKTFMVVNAFINSRSVIYGIAVFAFIVSFLVLPSSMSRSAWIAFIVGCGVVAAMQSQLRDFLFKHRFIVLIAVFIVVVGGGLAIYKLKQGSADGRLLMWDVGVKAVVNDPVTGVGIGCFPAAFAYAQVSHFKDNNDGAMVAGAPVYGFNEYIQIAVELGIVGLVLFLMLMFYSLKYLARGSLEYKVLFAGLVTLLVFALASYPFSLLPFLVLMVVILAVSAEVGHGVELNKLSKWIVVVITTVISVNGYSKMSSAPYREWQIMHMLYSSKQYDAVVEDYEKLYPMLKDNSRFLFEYGHTLSFTGKCSRAVEVLSEGARMSSDPMFYNIMGNSYKELGDIESAAKSYYRAYDMLPARIYPLYLLVKLYYEAGNVDEAKEIADKLIKHPDKVSSPATKQMRQEVIEIKNSL